MINNEALLIDQHVSRYIMALNTGIEGLPPQFVTSLRVLFDILDEDKTGLVKLSDLENRWEDGAVAGLPMGVIEALQKVLIQLTFVVSFPFCTLTVHCTVIIGKSFNCN